MRQQQKSDLVEFSIINRRPAIHGECCWQTVGAIEEWLATFDDEAVDVDLSGVTLFDSCALQTFLNAQRVNRRLRIVRPSPAVLRVLDLTDTYQCLVYRTSPPIAATTAP